MRASVIHLRIGGRALMLVAGAVPPPRQRSSSVAAAASAAAMGGAAASPRGQWRGQHTQQQQPRGGRGQGRNSSSSSSGGGSGSGRGGGGGGGRPYLRERSAPPLPPSKLAEASKRRPLAVRPDYFYAQAADATFESLGLSPAVAAALRRAGFARPSRAQELAVPALLAGRDVVLAAETGSGKTLAFLAPLADALLRAAADAAAADAGVEADDSGDAAAATPRPLPGRPRVSARLQAALAAAAREDARPLALVLVPNTALVAQALAAAAALRGADGAPLLRAVTVSSRCPPPRDRPDIVVTTPGALVTLLRGVIESGGGGYGRLWTPDGLAEAVRHVVVDEADLLLTGGYERDLSALLELLKVTERRQMEDAAAEALGTTPEALRALQRPQKLALWRGGVGGLLEAGWRPRGGGGAQAAPPRPQKPAAADDPALACRKQYVFVAATMPSMSKEDAGAELERRYAEAVWITGDLLHRAKPSVKHEWVDTPDAAARAPALVAAVTGGDDYAQGRARVLVFARDVAAADEASDVLKRAGVQHHVYHKAVSQEAREAALEAMAAAAAAAAAEEGVTGSSTSSSSGGGGGGNVVVVCTDAAARGIDLPAVTHVVQADFATNAVDFLHRAGRTARAGRGGRVTSIVGPQEAVLAAALRERVEAGLPVEACFSRNRSLRHKLRKYGEFVPRGEAGPSGGGRGAERRPRQERS